MQQMVAAQQISVSKTAHFLYEPWRWSWLKWQDVQIKVAHGITFMAAVPLSQWHCVLSLCCARLGACRASLHLQCIRMEAVAPNAPRKHAMQLCYIVNNTCTTQWLHLGCWHWESIGACLFTTKEGAERPFHQSVMQSCYVALQWK